MESPLGNSDSWYDPGMSTVESPAGNSNECPRVHSENSCLDI